MTMTRITRLAPSPTGALHLGNARTFLINWALARQQDWRIVLRVEDLDTPRTKPGADIEAVEDLRWQLRDLSPYHDALCELDQQSMIYPCRCTRKEIKRAQSAPHGDEHELRYPGTCLPDPGGPLQRWTADSDETDIAWRVKVPDQTIHFDDQFAGRQSHDVQQQVGDFVVSSKAGLPAYQLAVVIDDARQGVTDIVRGDDLLRSAARQLWLYRFLDLTPLPRYFHLPLIYGPDGRRLAKRHGDNRLSAYRHAGVRAQRVIGLIARWCGISESESQKQREMEVDEFLQRFDPGKLPRDPVTFTEQDHDWLSG